MMRKVFVGMSIVLAAMLHSAIAATISIPFETRDEARAVSGVEATNLYTARGVRFPSRPTIQRDGANQVLQQGEAGGRPDPLPDPLVCAPLVMEFNAPWVCAKFACASSLVT